MIQVQRGRDFNSGRQILRPRHDQTISRLKDQKSIAIPAIHNSPIDFRERPLQMKSRTALFMGIGVITIIPPVPPRSWSPIVGREDTTSRPFPTSLNEARFFRRKTLFPGQQIRFLFRAEDIGSNSLQTFTVSYNTIFFRRTIERAQLK
jgi:hypothetical protein